MLGNERYYHLAMQLVNKGVKENEKSSATLAEHDKSKMLERIAFTERLFPKVVVLLCSPVHKQIAYVSHTAASILGISGEYLKSLPPGGFIKLVHRDDIKGFKCCLEYIVNKKIDLQDDYRVIFYYRITNEKGEAVFIEDERMSLRNEKEGYMDIALLRNMTNEESFSGVSVKIYKRIKDKDMLLHEYFPETESNELTSRQRDIIRSIMMGLSNQEIANRLSLSVCTVKNHKQALFRKFGIGTSLELISMIKGVNRNNLSELFSGESQKTV